jgi:SPP1 family predicted phage head-tail adaptor
MTVCCDDKFSAGKFRHRITFQNLVSAINDSGGFSESWVTFQTVWAAIEPKLVPERNFAQRIEQITHHTIRCRYFAGLTSGMRISFGSRIFEIKSVVNVQETKQYYEILAYERTGT